MGGFEGWVGSRDDGAAGNFNGTIDEVRVYSRVLAPEEIRTHYLRGSGYGASGAITADKFRVVNTSGNVNLIVDNTGNVGIGATNPAFKLVVAGTLNVSTGNPGSVIANTGGDEMIVQGSGSAAGISILSPDASFSTLYFGSPTDSRGAQITWNHDNDVLNIETDNAGASITLGTAGGVEAVRIDSSGNVGIGTTTPATTLDVQGKLNVTGNTSIAQDTLFVDNTSSRVRIGFKAGKPDATLQIIAPSGGGELFRITEHADDGGTSLVAVESSSEGNRWIFLKGDANAGVVLDTRGSNPSYFVSGNVGINSTEPSETLTVNGTFSVVSGQSGNAQGLFQNAAGNVGIGTTTPISPLDVDGNVTIRGNLTVGNSALFVNSSGRVGIGTTSPSAPLHLSTGTPRNVIFNTNTDSQVIITTSNTGGDSTMSFENSGDGDNAWSVRRSNTGSFAISHSTGATYPSGTTTTKLIIDTSGNIGIGTGTPATTLDVAGKANFTGNFSVGGTSNILFVDNTSNRVGIGTSSPGVLADVSSSDGGVLRLSRTDTDVETSDLFGAVEFWNDDSGAGDQVRGKIDLVATGAAGNADMRFLLWNGIDITEKMRIKVAGNIGMNDTSPSETLDITGTLSVKSGQSGNAQGLFQDSAGNVGIGNTLPNNTLDVSGDTNLTRKIFAPGLTSSTGGSSVCVLNGELINSGSGTDCSASSLRFKENITELDYGLDIVMRMNPVSFNFKEGVNNDDSTRVGLIAEEVEKIDKRLVNYDKDNLPASIRYNEYTAILTKAIQEQQKQIDELKQELDVLKSK